LIKPQLYIKLQRDLFIYSRTIQKRTQQLKQKHSFTVELDMIEENKQLARIYSNQPLIPKELKFHQVIVLPEKNEKQIELVNVR